MVLLFKLLLIFYLSFNVCANNLPNSLFGVQLFDSIKNYDIKNSYKHKKKDGTRYRDFYVLNSVPNPNNAFSYYYAVTYPDSDEIINIRGLIYLIEIGTPVKLFKNNPNGEPSCTAKHMPKYVKAVSNAWQISENKFSDMIIPFYKKEIPQNLKKGFYFSAHREIKFKKNKVKLYAIVTCHYKYYAFGDEIDGVPVTNPIISSDLEITIGTQEYADRFIPTKIYKESVGNFIRKLYDGVSTDGF